MPDKADEVNALKEKGNSSLKNGKYEEAVLLYTHALKIDNKNHSLYSNRSLAFLKMQQYFFALEDAKEAIKLKTDWPKGYYRKGEVQFSVFNFNDALFSYTQALMLQPNEPTVKNAIKRTMESIKREEATDSQISWIGAALGIFIGAFIVVADQILMQTPTIVDPLTMVLLIFAVAILGYGTAKGVRYYVKCQRIALLEPPIDLLQEEKEKSGNVKETKGTSTRYKKAQARLRFKKRKFD